LALESPSSELILMSLLWFDLALNHGGTIQVGIVVLFDSSGSAGDMIAAQKKNKQKYVLAPGVSPRHAEQKHLTCT
jgi:hypothetical protein